MSDSPRVRALPHPDTAERVETGAVQFGNDWPGLFVRGDNAFFLALAIEVIERALSNLTAEAEARIDTDLDEARSTLREIVEIIRRDVIVPK